MTDFYYEYTPRTWEKNSPQSLFVRPSSLCLDYVWLITSFNEFGSFFVFVSSFPIEVEQIVRRQSEKNLTSLSVGMIKNEKCEKKPISFSAFYHT